jgi:hypothetical protein
MESILRIVHKNPTWYGDFCVRGWHIFPLRLILLWFSCSCTMTSIFWWPSFAPFSVLVGNPQMPRHGSVGKLAYEPSFLASSSLNSELVCHTKVPRKHQPMKEGSYKGRSEMSPGALGVCPQETGACANPHSPFVTWICWRREHEGRLSPIPRSDPCFLRALHFGYVITFGCVFL